MAAADRILVVSHDCDVVNSDLSKEPFVEVALAVAIDGREGDGNLTYGKNPRTLQIALAVPGDPSTLVLNADARWRVPRTLLLSEAPLNGLSPQATVLTAKWLGRRYDRSALPTEFNNRIAPAATVMRNEMRRLGARISALYVSLSSHAELPAGTPYQLTVVATMPTADFADPTFRGEAMGSITRVEAAFASCAGIVLLDVEVVPERDVSLEDLHGLTRWDLDYVSYRAGAHAPVAPRP